jgi:hypothetical protein
MSGSVARGLWVAALLLTSGCSVERLAANKIADTLAGSGTAYVSDDDPELVEAALPFSLKLMESALVQTPEHRKLLSATCAAFTEYSFAFVQQQGDALALDDSNAAWASWNRARKLYLRARDYGLRGLEVAHPGFRQALGVDRPRPSPRRARRTWTCCTGQLCPGPPRFRSARTTRNSSRTCPMSPP